MGHKIRTLRLVSLHFLIFIFIWLPFGCLKLIARLCRIQRVSKTELTSAASYYSQESDIGNFELLLVTLCMLLFFLYINLNPLIYLCLTEQLTLRECLLGKRANQTEMSKPAGENGEIQNGDSEQAVAVSANFPENCVGDGVTSAEFTSRFSTVELSRLEECREKGEMIRAPPELLI